MRKLLVASQKGGVGKTTTAINLATATALSGVRVLLIDADSLGSVSTALNLTGHASRRQLRDVGLDSNGTLCCDVTPGLDVLSPYQEGCSSPEDLERVLGLLGSDHFRGTYQCVIFHAPPFMGLRPRQLLQSCDEFIFVVRAEPMAFRTLPLLQETIKTIQREDGPIVFRGIVVTQPVAERWETDLRRFLGDKVLPGTIPIDPEVGTAEEQGQSVITLNADAPASKQYFSLAGNLGLATGARYAAPHPVPQRAVEKIAAVAAPALTRAVREIAALATPTAEAHAPRRPRPEPAAPRPSAPRRPEVPVLPRPAPRPVRDAAPVLRRPSGKTPPLNPRPTALRRKAVEKPEPFVIKLWHTVVFLSILFGGAVGASGSREFFVPLLVGLGTAGGVLLVVYFAMRKSAAQEQPATRLVVKGGKATPGRGPRPIRRLDE